MSAAVNVLPTGSAPTTRHHAAAFLGFQPHHRPLGIFPPLHWDGARNASNFDLSMLSLSAAHLEASYRCVGNAHQQQQQVKPSLPPSACGSENSWTQRVARPRELRALDAAKTFSSEVCRAKHHQTPKAESSDQCSPMNGLDRVAMTGPANGGEHLNWLSEGGRGGQAPIATTVSPLLPKPTLHSSSGSLFRPPGDSLYQFPSGGPLPLFYGQQASRTSGYGAFYAPQSQYSPTRYQTAPTSPGLIPPQQFFRLDQTFSPMDSLSPQLPHTGRTPFLNVQTAQSFGGSPVKTVPRTLYDAFNAKSWGEATEKSYSPSKKGSPDLEAKSYKIPCGREGSLKHRILRPPNITIVEPPASTLGRAPLSAPPLRNSSPYQEIPSPKYMKLSNTSRPHVPSYVPSAAAGSAPPQQHQYPVHFKKGSIIQLANNTLRKVEDLSTEDFLQSAQLSSDLRIDTSVVVRIQENHANKSAVLGFSVGQNQVQVAVDTPLEHPFFVFNRGWSSCSPQRSLELYGLTCDHLRAGDICISLTHKSTGPAALPLALAPSGKQKVTSELKDEPHKLRTDGAADNAVSVPQRKRRCSAPATVNLAAAVP